MSLPLTHTISACLIGAGAVVWATVGHALIDSPDLSAPVNPLGINGSPYGEVFAMAMQGPIDTYFHGTSRQHQDEHDSAPAESKTRGSLEKLIASLDRIPEIRTNPKAASQSHKFFLRRKIEDKLRFAYQLDPSHYANYNSLHFFLTEPELGTRPQLSRSAAKLAEDTIQYCLKQTSDPRPALTAAAAASNILELMFNDQHRTQPQFTTQQMRQYLDLLDYCLTRYNAISKVWDQTHNWDLLSNQRVLECQDRYEFLCKMRDTDRMTIERFEKTGASPEQAAN